MTMATTAAGQVASTDKPSCNSVLHLCDTALKEEIKVNALQKQLIADQDARYNILNSEYESSKAWYRNPITMILLGVLGGVILESQVHK